jgi:hypothetical protein
MLRPIAEVLCSIFVAIHHSMTFLADEDLREFQGWILGV